MLSNFTHDTDGRSLPVQRVENEDGATIVVDLGAAAQNVHTDIVDDTLLIVRERADGFEEPYELSLPEGKARTFIKNGVLTIEVRE